jgi:predicted NBD/HSP70 family sugar kinase
MGVRLFKRELLNDIPFFAYLYVGNGISCPLIQNNIGSSTAAIGPGELGYMIMDPSKPWGKYGSTGSLSSLSGERAVGDRCREAVDKGQAPILSGMCGGERPTMEQILAAQDAGEESICEIIKNAVFYLGIAIANIDNFVRPKTILVDSRLLSKEENRKYFLDTLRQNLFRPAFTVPDILFLDYDEFSGARGAAAVAIQTDLDSYVE